MHRSAVTCLAWSALGDFLLSADDKGKVGAAQCGSRASAHAGHVHCYIVCTAAIVCNAEVVLQNVPLASWPAQLVAGAARIR